MKTSEDHRRKEATPMFALYQAFYLIAAIVYYKPTMDNAPDMY